MALPEQVIERLSKESPQTPGWSVGLLAFSGGILLIALLIYFGLAFGYEPYLDSRIAQLDAQMDTLAKSISAGDMAQFTAFYSEITNLKAALGTHVVFSRFLLWLEKNTEANVYYSRFTFSSGNQIVLSAIAPTEADVNQQVAIFEAAPEVKSVNLSAVSLSPTGGQWQFTVTLIVDPPSVLREPQ
ncbi:MAG: hypothetical protein ABSE18_00245 [Minisyncoccia bacterium]|jgi:hypothetical protein